MLASRNAVPFLFAVLLSALGGATFAQTVTFAPATSVAVGPPGVSPVAMAVRDLSGDAKPDLAVANGFTNPGTVAILLGTGSGSFGGATTLTTGAGASSVAIGDLNADGHPDLAITSAATGSVWVQLGTGTGTFVPAGSYAVGGVPTSVLILDFNRDGRADLVVGDQTGNSVSVLLGNAGGTFGSTTTFAVGTSPVAIAAGNFNGDAIPDLVTANAFSGDISILLSGMGPATSIPLGGGNPSSVAVADMNADGRMDIVVGRGGAAPGVSILLGNGNGTFAPPLNVALSAAVTGVAVADFDGDGKLDVAASAGAGSVYVLPGSGTGSLGAPSVFAIGAGPRAIVVGDFNGDAIPDLATADLSAGTVSILLNATPFVVGALAWGDNRDGALGDGTTTNRSSPVAVLNLGRVLSVSAGFAHAVAVKADGTAWLWGGNFTAGLGNGTLPVQVPGLASAVAAAAGGAHTLALLADSTVRAWGLNGLGQLGDGTGIDSDVPVTVTGLSGVVAIAAGLEHSLALKADGTVWAWGSNSFGQLGDGTIVGRLAPVQVTGLSGVVAIATGASSWHSLAVKTDGSVWAWGWNGWGQLGDGTYIDRLAPVQVAGLADVKSVAAGTGHSVALRIDGAVRTWGLNNHGQLGNGTMIDTVSPVPVASLTGITSVSAGQTHTVVLRADGTVWSWGANGFSGQLGDGTLVDRPSPVQVVGLSRVTAVATGGQHSVVIAPSNAPPASIAALASMVQAMSLQPGVSNALLATLDAAQRAIDNGNTNAACGQLGAFARQVQAFSGRSLTLADASRLTSLAGQVRAIHGCR
jgi:alpha-tubulin suppressor-like RCC1 family protein